MEQLIEQTKTNGAGNGRATKKSQPVKVGSVEQINHSIFDPMKYMLKLPKNKKVTLGNGQVRWEQSEAEYLPVAARIAWFRKDHPYWSIVTKFERLADKAVVMKAIIKDMQGTIIATDLALVWVFDDGRSDPADRTPGRCECKVRSGDYSQRVPASRPDEIGQLEGKFNLMARQLIDNFERQQVLAEQSARIEQEMTSWAYARPGFSRRRSPNRGG